MKLIDKETMLNLIIDAKRTDPETGSFAEWLAEYLVEQLPTLNSQNEPLSWTELTEMAGNPVYIVEIGVCEYWALVKFEYNGGVYLAAVNNIDDYGSESLYGKTWLAYRRPPERQEDTE